MFDYLISIVFLYNCVNCLLLFVTQAPTLNGGKGVFEWIVDPNGDMSHRRFIENGVITGKPNQIPKK